MFIKEIISKRLLLGLPSIWFFLFVLHTEIDRGSCVMVPMIRIYELDSGNLTMLQDPPNQDVVLPTNHDNPDRYLILQCRAPYPVQWIYGGDGIPEFITNTTVSWETEPKMFIASAGLFRLFEHHTGTYTCRSIHTPHLSAYYHIFFTGDNLLSSSAGDTISFSRHDPTVRIPCSVSDPTAHVTLQKLVNGYISCPVNDTITFNKKMGFTLKVSKHYQPYGDYICIAHSKAKFSVLEFKVVMEELEALKNEKKPRPELMPSLKPARPSISTTSTSDVSSPNFIARPTKASPRPSARPHFSPHADVSKPKCNSFNCGRNALCQLNASDQPVCKCEAHFKGDPYSRCYPECIIDDDCPWNRICFDNACENPCPSACGVAPAQLLSCSVSNHTAMCTYHHCNPSPCGSYSECRHLARGAVCSCLPGYYGRPPYCSSTNSISSIGQGFGQALASSTTLRVTDNNNNYFSTPTSPTPTTTTTTTTTTTAAAFVSTLKPKPVSRKPLNPSPGSPVDINHPNFVLNTNTKQESDHDEHDDEEEKEVTDQKQATADTDVRIPATPGVGPTAVNVDDVFDPETDTEVEVDRDPNSCRLNSDCNITDKCVDRRCKDPCRPNPCGRSTICSVHSHEPICTCSPGFIRVNQYCLITNCKSNRDCPENKSCVRNKCINPCAGYCGKNAECIIDRHSPGCRCPAGFTGDPYKDCNRLPIESIRAADDTEQEQVEVFKTGVGSDSPGSEEFADSFEEIPMAPVPFTLPSPSPSPPAPSPSLSTLSPQKPTMLPTPGIISPFKFCGQVLKCGTNAHCIFNASNSASTCKCEDGFSGDPYRICYLKLVKPDDLVRVVPEASEEFIEIGNIFKNKNSYSGNFSSTTTTTDTNKKITEIKTTSTSTSVAETTTTPISSSLPAKIKIKYQGPGNSYCVRDADCPSTKSCIGDTCMNPCSFASICGENQDCFVRDHKASCECRKGFPIKIYNNCYAQDNNASAPVVLCEPSPCGPNSDCSLTKIAPYVSCKCKPNMVGRPPNCRSTCIVNYECPEKLACVNSTCQDPCDGVCGYLARCRVYQHQAKCFCPQGFKLVKENGIVQCQAPLFPDSTSRNKYYNTNSPNIDVLSYAYGTSGPYTYSSEEIVGPSTVTDRGSSSFEATTNVDNLKLQSDSEQVVSALFESSDSEKDEENDENDSKFGTTATGTTVTGTEAGIILNLKESLDQIGNQNPDKNSEFNSKLGIAAAGSQEYYFNSKSSIDKHVFDNPIFPMPDIPYMVKKVKVKSSKDSDYHQQQSTNVNINAKHNKVHSSKNSNAGGSRFKDEDFEDDSNEFQF